MDTSAETLPLTESYLHLSRDSDTRSDTSARAAAAFGATELVDLAKKIDGGDSDIELTDLHDDALPLQLGHARISSHLTPLVRKPRDVRPRISLDALARLLQPMLSDEFREFKQTLREMLSAAAEAPRAPATQPATPPRHALPQSDAGHLSDAGASKDSPGTTPPNSQDNARESTLLDNGDSFAPGCLLKPIRNSEADQLRLELEQMRQQNERLTQQNERLTQQNERLTQQNEQRRLAPAADSGLPEAKRLKQANAELSIKLDNARRHAEELRNELAYTKANSQADQLAEQLRAQLGDPQQLLDARSLGPGFDKYYDRLGLGLVDRLTKVQMSNMLKRLTLTLMISLFEQLPQNMVRVTKYVKMASQFLDRVHELVYGVQAFTPSMYLRSGVDVAALQQCLDLMYAQIKHYIPE